MQNVEIRTKNNGFVVRLDQDENKDYVYKSTEVFEMMEFVGRYILGRKIKVKEN